MTFKSSKFTSDMINAREAGSITLRALAEKTKITIGTLHRIEAGQIPNVSDFASICGSLKLKPTNYIN